MSSTERAVRDHAVDDSASNHDVDEDDRVAAAAPDDRSPAHVGFDEDDASSEDDSGAITAPALPGQPPLKSRRTPPSADPSEPSSNGRSRRSEPAAPDLDDMAPPSALVPEPPLVAPVATPARVFGRTPSPLDDSPTVEAPAVTAPLIPESTQPEPEARAAPETQPVPEAPIVETDFAPDMFDGGNDPEVSRPPAPVVRRTLVDAERHLIAPVTRPVGRRPRARKVTRVLRHVDPWSVFKVAAVFSMVVYGVVLTAGVLLWNVAYSTGTIDNIEQFFESFGWSNFEFEGGEIYHSAWIAGLFIAVAMTGFAVLGATLFNLITDLVGGVRMTVLEEEVVERTDSPMRRFTVRRNQPLDRSPATATAGPPVEDQAVER